ncbi:hypothetical protein HII13_003725 [Brettanomyces bruxellensis]|nr:hypothetical protein HII13_003725 [Brettanomyces bruxellensis]
MHDQFMMSDTTPIDIGEPLPLEYNTIKLSKPNKAVANDNDFIGRLKRQMLEQLGSQAEKKEMNKTKKNIERTSKPPQVETAENDSVPTRKIKIRKVSGPNKVIGQPLPLNYSGENAIKRQGIKKYHDLGCPLPLKYVKPVVKQHLKNIPAHSIETSEQHIIIEPDTKEKQGIPSDGEAKLAHDNNKDKLSVPRGYKTGYVVILIISILCYISYLLAD